MQVIILTALRGLGTYIPAVYLYKYLKLKGVNTELLIWEDYYNDTSDKMISLYQTNPRIAEFAYALGAMNEEQFKLEGETGALETIAPGIKTYICFSGIWHKELLAQQKRQANPIFNVVMDVVPSQLWKNQLSTSQTNSHTIFTLGETLYLPGEIPSPSEYKNREGFLLQGGGWNLIDYMEINKYPFLKEGGITMASTNPITETCTDRHLLYKISSIGEFPNLADKEINHNQSYHSLLDEYNKVRGCISKPGGMTIVDAITTCTPLLFTQTTIGQHELANREFCLKLGIAYEICSLKTKSRLKNQLTDLRAKLEDYRACSSNLCSHIYNLL